MKNKLVVIINSLEIPKIKKILLREMKFLVPNYCCLQNHWLGGYCSQIPVLSVLCPQLNLLNPPQTKFLGTPLHSAFFFRGKESKQSRLLTLEMKTLPSLETLPTACTATHHHIPKDCSFPNSANSTLHTCSLSRLCSTAIYQLWHSLPQEITNPLPSEVFECRSK
jgi:hypothetical protein